MSASRGISLGAVVAVAWVWVAGCGGSTGTSRDGSVDLATPPSDAAAMPDQAPGGIDGAPDAAPGPDLAAIDGPSTDARAADGASDEGGADRPPSAVADIESYCRRHAERLCAAMVQCTPQVARSTEAECVTSSEETCLHAARAWQIPGVMAGRVAFDPAAAAACLEGSDRGPCGLAWTSEAACRRVFEPRVASGGACLNDGECLGGICDRTQTCPGVCAAQGKPGDDCSRYPCDPAVAACAAGPGPTRQCVAKTRGMVCRPHTSDCAAVDYCRSMRDGLPCQSSPAQGECVCAARAPAGGACKLADECAPGLGCAGGQCRAPVSQQGEPCSYAQGVTCAGGLACLITDGRRSALAGTCGPMRPEGSACYWVECQRGLDCAGASIDESAPRQGTCRAKAGPGQACRPFGCTLGYLCDQGVCVSRPAAGQSCVAIGGGERFCFGPGLWCSGYSRGTCTQPPAVGQPCGEACDGAGYCDPFGTGTCLRRKAAGQVCLNDRECDSGTCSLQVCAPRCPATSS
jgi:hypothetical protein